MSKKKVKDKNQLQNLGAGISRVLKEKRESLGLSRKELAERADLHLTYIYGIEKGSANLSLKALGKLASALDTTVLELITCAENNSISKKRSLKETSSNLLIDSMPPSSILLIEDNPGDIHFIIKTIASNFAGCTVEVVKEGQEALDLLLERARRFGASKLPDLILIDLNLPGTSGFEVLEQIKSNKLLKQIACVVLTTSSAESDRKRCRELHANSFITKRARPKEFADDIRNILQYWFLTAGVQNHSSP